MFHFIPNLLASSKGGLAIQRLHSEEMHLVLPESYLVIYYFKPIFIREHPYKLVELV